MKLKKIVFIALPLLLLVGLFQNCAPEGFENGSFSSLSSETTQSPLSIITGQGGSGISINPDGNGGFSIDDSDVSLTPEDLANLPGDTVSINTPADCVSSCEQRNDCNAKTGQERTQCQNSCSATSSGMCGSFEISKDPNTLKSFTVPAGYKRAQVTIRHCTSRHDVLTIEGPTMRFKTMNPVRKRNDWWSGYWYLGLWNWWGYRQAWLNKVVSPEVGRAAYCGQRGLANVAKVTISTQNANGSFSSVKTYNWKQPATQTYSFGKIPDIDGSAVTFVNMKTISGPGAKLQRIYDNHKLNGQLSFLVEYIRWYNWYWWGWYSYQDPVVTTTFDLWYRKDVAPQL